MKNLFITALLFVIYSCHAFSQEAKLQGIIIDSSTGQALQGVYVQLNNSGKTTLSGYDGSFYFEGISAKSDILTISSSEMNLFQRQIQISPNEMNDLGTISVSRLAQRGSFCFDRGRSCRR